MILSTLMSAFTPDVQRILHLPTRGGSARGRWRPRAVRHRLAALPGCRQPHDWHSQQFGRLDPKDRGELGDDSQPRIARARLQLGQIDAVGAHRGLL